MFFPWAARSASTVEVCAVEYPGHGTRFREQPFSRLLPLARALVDDLERELECPFAFYGHSMGALVAFEVAREMRRRGLQEPVQLFVGAAAAPQLLRHRRRRIQDLAKPEFLDAVRKLNGTPEEVLADEELMEILVPVLRADFAVFETFVYAAEPPLRCPIAAFGGLDDEHIDRRAIRAWREQTRDGFWCGMLPGDHFFLTSERERLLATLGRHLEDRAAASASGAAG